MQSLLVDLSRVPPHVAAAAVTIATRAETAAAAIPVSVPAPASVARLIAVLVMLLLQLEGRHRAAVPAARPAVSRGESPGRLFRPAQDCRPLAVRVLGEQSAQFFADVVFHFLQ